MLYLDDGSGKRARVVGRRLLWPPLVKIVDPPVLPGRVSLDALGKQPDLLVEMGLGWKVRRSTKALKDHLASITEDSEVILLLKEVDTNEVNLFRRGGVSHQLQFYCQPVLRPLVEVVGLRPALDSKVDSIELPGLSPNGDKIVRHFEFWKDVPKVVHAGF